MTQFYIPSNAPEQCMYYGYTLQEQQHNRFFHPAVRQEMALDMSLKKLHSIKLAQRSSHRQADLLKTVLVYNMFKAAMCSAPTQNTNDNYKNSADCGLDMDVDIGCGNESSKWASSVRAADDVQMDQDSETAEAEAAEQSWFDRCIDRVLTEDEQDIDYGQPETDEKKPQDILVSRGSECSASSDDGPILEDATVASPTEEYIDGAASHIVPDTGTAGATLKRSPSSASIQSLRMQQKQNGENALLLLATASSHHKQQRHRTLAPSDPTDDAVIGGGPTTASYTIHL
ncbi:hypothetical protein GGI23_002880 [Coemansia sp. RSA 2559]|nr:hypothetical protein GGI23_002880 [Coemansia sp. RSA 2559]